LKEVFLSYAHEDKVQVGKVKQILEANGLSAFLAHEDIDVSKQWRDEILRHLDTCSGLVAIVTENFSKSAWANQEVGIAIGKKLEPIPLLFGPSQLMKGFIEMYQAEIGNENNFDSVVKGIVPKINQGVSSEERAVLNNLKTVLGRLIARWNTYLALQPNDKWTEAAVIDIQDTFGEERENLLTIISENTNLNVQITGPVNGIIIHIQRFRLHRFDFQAHQRELFAENRLPYFQELENRGNQVFEPARALHTWLIQTQQF
jgi:hypothetical protein